jgi:cytochrome c-type biogenesis protein CcmH/NrfG
MGLLAGLIGLPFAPLRGTVWLAQQIADEADRRMNDPAFIRQQLDEIATARSTGALPPEEADRMERELVGRLLHRARLQRGSRGGAEHGGPDHERAV